ncbi:hypothetical protein Efla_007247 [Eimeria flavescens]
MEQQQSEPPPGALSFAESAETMSDSRLSSSTANGPSTQDDDPPRKRRLLFPKARPKKIQEFLGRNLNATDSSSRASQIVASKQASPPPRQPPIESGNVEAVVCGGRSFEEIMAAAGIGSEEVSKPQNPSADSAASQRPPVRPQRLKCTMSADKASSDSMDVSTSVSCARREAVSASAVVNEGSASCGELPPAAAVVPPPLSASTSLLDSSCLGVQRLTLHSPSSNQADSSHKPAGLTSGKSPPEKRPSSGLGELGEADEMQAMSDLGDGGLGPLQKAADYSGIPLAVRLQSKAVKQRVHGCDEVVMRLGSCSSSEDRVQLWNEIAKQHLSGILKDTNVLVGSKAVEMLVALVKGNDPVDPAAVAAPFPAAAALPLIQQNGKLIVTQLLSNPRHFASCCEVMLTLSQASSECATETVSLLAAINQQLLEERKGNVAAIKGQGVRVLASSMELLLQMLQAFGIQLILELGGVKGLIQPVAAFALCSDKKVRAALSTMAGTCVYLTRVTAGDVAGAAAKKTVMECLKGSKSMQTEVEQVLEKFATEPPTTPTRKIAGTACPPGSVDEASKAPRDAGDKGGNATALLLSETDVIKAICQQQTDWVVRITEGRQPVASGDREGAEEAPWKVKLQAWQQLEAGLRDCVCLYKKNPFMQQQLLPLLHRVLTVEPTLPVVTCALKTLQLLVQLLLQPRSSEGSQQLQQQLRVLLPDVLAKLKVNNRPVQVAACACLGTYLCSLPIDVVVGDLLPVKEKLAHFQKLLLDELTKAVGQQGGTPALHKAAGLLLAAAKTAAEDGNAAVRAAGVSLLAALATHAEGSAAVGNAMQKLSEQKKQQLQKALASSSAATPAAAAAPSPVVSSPRRATLPTGSQGTGVPFARMRSRGAATAAPSAPSRPAAPPSGSAAAPGQAKVIRKQGSASSGSVAAKGSWQRAAASTGTSSASAPPASAPSSSGAFWEVPPLSVSAEDAEKRTQELVPAELLQGLDTAVGVERKRAYSALEAWCRRPCECTLCTHSTQEGHMDADEDRERCKVETFRKSAVHVLLHLRSKLKGFRERTAALEDSCISCLKSILGGLLLPTDMYKAVLATTKNPDTCATSTAPISSKRRSLPPVDRSIVNVVLEPLGDRLGDPRVGNDVLLIGLLLARCIDTPTTVAAQLALLTEGRAAGGRMIQGVCSLLEQMLQQWGLQSFTPPKQLLMIVRQLLEPNKGTRSVVFPLLKRLHGEMGDKVVTAMLVAHPLPDDIKHALKKQPQQNQQQQQQQQPQQQHEQHQQQQQSAPLSQQPDGSEMPWENAAAAITAGATAAAAAVRAASCCDSTQKSGSFEVSVGQYITPELLQRLQQGNHEEVTLKALNELMDIFVNKAGQKVRPEGLSGLVTLLRKRIGDSSAAVRRQVLQLLIVFCDRLGTEGTPAGGGAAALPSAARVYKQMLPTVAEYLCDVDKKNAQLAHLATAKWFNAVGVDESLPLLQPFLSSSISGGVAAASPALHKGSLGSAALRRAFYVGHSANASPQRNAKLRDALFNILVLTMPMDASSKAPLMQALIHSLLDALLPQSRADETAEVSPASVLITLLTSEGGHREVVKEVLKQRQIGQNSPSPDPPSAESALNSVLVSGKLIKLLVQARQSLRDSYSCPIKPSQEIKAQSDSMHQKPGDLCKEERPRITPISAPVSPTESASLGSSTAGLSTRSQRIQKSSGGGFVTARRHQGYMRDELYNELKGRLDPQLFLLMFPPSSAATAGGGRQVGIPQLAQLKGALEAWQDLFRVNENSPDSQHQQGGLRHPLHGEQSITDLMLRWIAFCISETQQQRTVQAQECLCVLLQMIQPLLQPYFIMRVTLPLYEQQQILQQLLDVASVNAASASISSTTTKPVAKQIRQLVRDALLLLAAIAEDRTKFLSAIHRSLIRCKNKDLLVDLMAAMSRALGQHVQTQLQSKNGATTGTDALSDFLSQQCAARFFSFLADPKASVEQRALAFDFLVLCNLVVKGGTLHLLPSLSPEIRARIVEATKQIQAGGLPQSRLDALVPRHCEPCTPTDEHSTQPPALEARPPSEASSELAVVADPGELDGDQKTALDNECFDEASGSCCGSPAPQAMAGAADHILPETGMAEAVSVSSPTSALVSAVAQADALLQVGGEELQQQASALQGWLAAARELRTQSKISEAAFTSCLDSTMQQDTGCNSAKEAASRSATGTTGPSVEQLCCLTALKAWCSELQLRSLPRAAFGAHSLVFLLTSAPPNPNSATAAAAKAAAASSAQAVLERSPTAQERPLAQTSDQQATRRSGRQAIQLTSVGETVLSAHPLCSHFVLEGITKALAFFFEPQNYTTLLGAGLSLQGAASALLLADAVTRRRMLHHKGSGETSSLRQKSAVLLPTYLTTAKLKDGVLEPLPDKMMLQRCCSCLLLCMGRYQEHLYKSPIAASPRPSAFRTIMWSLLMDPRFGPVRYLVTFLLNQVLGRNILQGDLRVLSCIAECCFTEAAQAIGSAYQGAHRRPSETLWRLVAKVHKKAVPLLEKYAATAQQPEEESPDKDLSSSERQKLHFQALGVLELINTIVTSLSLLDGAYHTARLLVEQRRQQQGHAHQTPPAEGQAIEVNAEQQESPLAAIHKDREMFLLHAKLFMHSFVSLCPVLLGVHLKATGVAESAERSAWLERLLRGYDCGNNEESATATNDASHQAECGNASSHVRGADEACKALRSFSCSAIIAQLTTHNTQRLLMCHRDLLEGACKRPADDNAMQVDSPRSGQKGAPNAVKAALKGKEIAMRSLFARAGINSPADEISTAVGGGAVNRPLFEGDSIKEQPHDSTDDFTLHPMLQKIRQTLISPSQQRTLLQSPSGALGRGAGCEAQKDRAAVHMLRFCAGTAAVLPHHKLATLRSEAASSDRLPTDWLDLASVAHSYKLDVQPSQSSGRAPAPQTEAAAASQVDPPACSVPSPSDCGETHWTRQKERAQTALGQASGTGSARNGNARTECLALSSTLAHLSKDDAQTTDRGAGAMSNPTLTGGLRLGQQHSVQGSTTRSSSMKNLRGSSGDPRELPGTPMTVSKLPQCAAARLLGPAGSPSSSHERTARGGSMSSVTHSFIRRSSKPEVPRGSHLSDAH